MVLGLLIIHGLFCWLKFVEIYNFESPHPSSTDATHPRARAKLFPFHAPLDILRMRLKLTWKVGGGQ